MKLPDNFGYHLNRIEGITLRPDLRKLFEDSKGLPTEEVLKEALKILVDSQAKNG